MDEVEQGLNRYPDGGTYRLHEALAARHGVGFEEVCAGSGADGCIDMLSQAILGPGDEVVCGWPSFPSYVIYAAKQGATVTRVPLHELRYDLVALAAAVGPQTKIVYVCHPNNPTGTMNTRAELDDFFDRLPDSVLPVVDQAYFEYIDHDGYPDAVAEYFLERRRIVVAPHVLEDLRPRGGPGRLRRRAAGHLRRDGEGAPAFRPDDDGAGRGAGERRRRRRDRPAARAEQPGPRSTSAPSSSATASIRPREPSATSSTSTSARKRLRSSSASSFRA